MYVYIYIAVQPSSSSSSSSDMKMRPETRKVPPLPFHLTSPPEPDDHSGPTRRLCLCFGLCEAEGVVFLNVQVSTGSTKPGGGQIPSPPVQEGHRCSSLAEGGGGWSRRPPQPPPFLTELIFCRSWSLSNVWVSSRFSWWWIWLVRAQRASAARVQCGGFMVPWPRCCFCFCCRRSCSSAEGPGCIMELDQMDCRRAEQSETPRTTSPKDQVQPKEHQHE